MLNNLFYPVCLYTRQHIERLPDFSKSYRYAKNKAKGLCNQLFALSNGIIEAINKNKKFVIIDSFSACINSCKICPISEILDLEKIKSNLLNNNINIYLFDRSNIKFSFIEVKYGTDINNSIDLTIYFTNNKKILIDKNININKFFNVDPYPRKPKKIFIKYKINGYIFTEIN